MTETTITFHQDERPAAEASRYHDVRAYRDPVKDKKYFEQTGHEHILPQYTHLNRDLVAVDLDDYYDEVFTQPLAEWNAKQKHKAKRVGKGLALPAGVEKSDAPAYAKAVRVILYEKYKLIEPGYDAISLLSDPDVYDKYEALSKAHPKAKKEYWLSQLEVYTTAKTAGEMYLGELRAGVRDGVKGAVRPSYGFILQYGSCDDPTYTEDRSDPYWQRGADMLEEALERFKHDNPTLRVIEATIHVDEAKKPPHMHVEVVPVVEQKRGRPLVTSMTGALKAEGYERKDKSFDAGIDAWTRWADDQRQAMAEIAKDHGLTPVKGKEGAHEANSRLYRLGRQIEEAAQEYASVRLLIDEATYELDSVGHAKTQTEAERATADQQLADSKAELARVTQEIDDLHKTEKTLRETVKDLREHYQAELAKTTGAEESLKESAKALRDAVDEVFSSQTLAGMGLDTITEGTDKAADEDKSLDDLVAEATSRVTHMLDLDITDPFLDKYIKVVNRQKKAEAEAKAAEDKAEDEKARADSAFDVEYKAKKQKLDKREKDLDDREQKIAEEKAKAHKSALEAARLLRERKKALDEREEKIDQEIEAEAEEKAKTKLNDKIKQAISDFKYRVRYGYAEKAYDIYHYKDIRYWRSKTEAEQGEYLEARDQYAQQVGISLISYGDVDKACLSRNLTKKPYRRMRCVAHGLLKGIFGAKKDAEADGLDVSGILPGGFERDVEAIEQKTYSAEKLIR